MLDDDFVICGYISKGYIRTLILGQYSQEALTYKGQVTGISKQVFDILTSIPEAPYPFSGKNGESIRWIKPSLVCKVKLMEYTTHGEMR